MLLQDKISKVYWAKVVHIASYIVNKSPVSWLTLRLLIRYVQKNPRTIYSYEYFGIKLIVMFMKEILNQGKEGHIGKVYRWSKRVQFWVFI